MYLEHPLEFSRQIAKFRFGLVVTIETFQHVDELADSAGSHKTKLFQANNDLIRRLFLKKFAAGALEFLSGFEVELSFEFKDQYTTRMFGSHYHMSDKLVGQEHL